MTRAHNKKNENKRKNRWKLYNIEKVKVSKKKNIKKPTQFLNYFVILGQEYFVF